MRIVYLHQYFVTPEMSGGTRSYEMARRLVAAGHQVDMVTADATAGGASAWRITEEAGIRVHWAGVPYDNRMGRLGRLLAFVKFAWRATWRASRLPGDVVFATSTPLTIAIPGMLAAAVRRRPFVFEVRDQWPDVPIAIGALRNPIAIGLARALERLTYRRARQIVALAPGMREDIIAKGVSSAKVTVIPNGCDLGLFGVDESVASRVRAAHPWLGERPLVIFTGTFGEVNGVEYLIRVAAEVRTLAPDVRFALFGAGRDVDRVRALAAELDLLDRSVFIHAPVPKARIAEWLAAADVSVALFRGPAVVWKDAVQNKFFDAIASGCAVACNFDGWQTRIAEDAQVGFRLDPADPAAAAATLVGRLRDRAWMDAVPERARQLAQERFDRDRLAGDLDSVFRRAMTE